VQRVLFVPLALLLLVTAARGQAPATTHVKIHAVLVDKDLNQKPVPRLAVSLQRVGAAGEAITLRTGFDGLAETDLPAGQYRLVTPEPEEFEGKRYSWDMEIAISGGAFSLDLSNDNAKVADITAVAARSSDDLTAQFKRLNNSVVTVYSELGHGTGFLVDPRGLIVTNNHVVKSSEYLAVQFNEKRKAAATLLASDAQKDIAVLWVNLEAFPDAVTATIAKQDSDKAAVSVGERVFTIGSPMMQQKVLTTGIVSHVEPKAIISDVNINPGNSGGPLFNIAGNVIGVTTYNEQAQSGPGLSGVVRIEEALPLIQQAQDKIKQPGATPPSAALLPVDPIEPFPFDALQAAATPGKVDRTPYFFSAGDFDVAIFTPPLAYRLYVEQQREMEKERAKRDKKRGDAEPDKSGAGDEKNWRSDEHPPVVTVRVTPQLKVKFWASMATPGEVKARFKTDFYRMRLLCAGKELTPILPAKFSFEGGNYGSVEITDTTYFGMYDYLPDAIAPSCGQMTLEIYPDKTAPPTVKALDSNTIQAVWSDFEPYRKSLAEPAAPTTTPAPAKK
jgi:S1-C subfamily serine protease